MLHAPGVHAHLQVRCLPFATGGVLVVAPSPLAGEGSESCPHMRTGEGAGFAKALHPSLMSTVRSDRLALSRKGRGHSNARQSLAERGGQAAS